MKYSRFLITLILIMLASSSAYGWIDIRDFGARPGEDSTLAIQAAVDEAASNHGEVVLIPPGIFKTSGSGITIHSPSVYISGMGEGVSTILHSGEMPAFSVVKGASNVKLSHFKIMGRNATSDAILLSDNCSRYSIENVWISSFLNGAAIRATRNNHYGHVSRVELNNNSIGISVSGSMMNDVSYSKIYNNLQYGIELRNCSGISVLSSQIEKNGAQPYGASIAAFNTNGINIRGGYNEQNASFPGAFLSLSNCRAVNIHSCRSIGNKAAPICIQLENIAGISFIGNSLRTFSQAHILLPLGSKSVQEITWLSNDIQEPIGDKIW